MRILIAFFALSIVLHLLVLFFFPGFSIIKSPSIEVVPISVEIQKKELKENPPISNTQKSNQNKTYLAKKEKNKAVKQLSKNKTQKSTVQSKSPASPKTAEKSDFKAPDIDSNLLTSVESDISTNMNKLLDNQSKNDEKDNGNYMGRFIQDELSSNSKNQGTPKDNTASEVGREIGSAQGNIDSDFINFDEYPTNNRAIVYVPPKPDFSLPNDTKIKVKFSVDGNGNVYDIILITRNIRQVEDIAEDYVKNLKFAANGRTDSARITLNFKVIR